MATDEQLARVRKLAYGFHREGPNYDDREALAAVLSDHAKLDEQDEEITRLNSEIVALNAKAVGLAKEIAELKAKLAASIPPK